MTTLAEIVRVRGGGDYVYFADQAHCPYGNKSADEMTAIVRGGVKRLIDVGAELIVLACNTATACEIRSVVFSAGLITGGKDTVFAKKYIAPLAGCTAFRAHVFDRGAESGSIGDFLAACRALAEEAPGYEFTVREKLSAVCLALCRRFAAQLSAAGPARPNQDEVRIQQMLGYIQNNFSHPITLSDIARAAGIGERECLRCFGKTIHLPPMQYLLKYRIMQGAAALLARPGDSIAQVAAGCGFDSPSNFSQQFRRFYGCTPREYRNRKP